MMEPPLYFFDHPFPRYGLAVTLQHHRVRDLPAALADEEALARLAAPLIEEGLERFRIHTTDSEEATVWKYRYLAADELETSGQGASDRYFMAPHVATDDTSAGRLIKECRKSLKKLADGFQPNRSTELKRSFSPFVTKINAGTRSLSNPKTTQLEALFSLVATVTPHKPARQVDFTNQVIVPDLDLRALIDFVTVFRDMVHTSVAQPLQLERREGSKRRRPPLFDGNYPNAPRGSAFGPVGLLGAIGQWMRAMETLGGDHSEQAKRARSVLDKVAGGPVYLVSYDSDLMRQAYVGHHAARLAARYDLPAVLAGLYKPEFYNRDHKPGSPQHTMFQQMAARFLHLYTRSAFRDFLAYRVQYRPSLQPILDDYFMHARQALDADVVRSARAYGAYLNLVAYLVAKNETDTKDTGRSLYEAKTNALAQLESTAMSVRRPSALFAQLNVMAGRFADSDVPLEAERFMEAAHTGEIEMEDAQELVLAYMRLRSPSKQQAEADATADDDPFLKDEEPA